MCTFLPAIDPRVPVWRGLSAANDKTRTPLRTKAAVKAKGALGNLYTLEDNDLLKDALMYKRLRKNEESKKTLKKIITEYPQSIAAGKARHLMELVDVDYENDLFFDLEYKLSLTSCPIIGGDFA